MLAITFPKLHAILQKSSLGLLQNAYNKSTKERENGTTFLNLLISLESIEISFKSQLWGIKLKISFLGEAQFSQKSES